jgi:ribulose-phosphate 3-epimerase
MTARLTTANSLPSLIQIKALGKKAGLGVNPPMAITAAEPYLDRIDLLLVMTVNPGFGGQEFIRERLVPIEQATAWRRDKALGYRIRVDGGIKRRLCPCRRDTFVAGTSLFGASDLKSAVAQLRRSVNGVVPH